MICFPDDVMMLMSSDHFVCFSFGRAIVRDLVLIIQPSICLDSSILPYAINFFMEMMVWDLRS
jgi:hypothetical protein